jgi:hypothetical protein
VKRTLFLASAAAGLVVARPRLARAGPASLFPTSISGLGLWLDGTYPSSFTISTGVSAWADKSGKGNNAVQATAGNQPPLGSLFGWQVPTYNGTSSALSAASSTGLPSGAGSAVTVFFAFAFTNGFGNYERIFSMGTEVGVTGMEWYKEPGLGLACQVGGGGGMQNTNISLGAVPHVVSAVYTGGNISGTSYTQWLDGTVESMTQYSGGGTPAIGASAPFDVGVEHGSPTEWWFGPIGAVLVYAGALSTANRQIIEGLLCWEFGSFSLMASSHPYAGGPPAGWSYSYPHGVYPGGQG